MSSTLIEPGLSPQALAVHQALASLQEELEAIDLYQQRVDHCSDESLQAVLGHNRDDEMEHAVMLLEWLRRCLPALDGQMRKLLFSAGSIPARTAAAPVPPAADLGLGSLK